MPRKKKLTPEQQAASEKIGKILSAKERGEPVKYEQTTKEEKPGNVEDVSDIPDSRAALAECANSKEEESSGDGENMAAWQRGLCERIAQGEAVGAVLADYAISNAKFISERDSNPEFKRKLDEAFGVVAEMVTYGMYHAALAGNSTEKKAYAPLLLEKYGKKDERASDDDKPEGTADGLDI